MNLKSRRKTAFRILACRTSGRQRHQEFAQLGKAGRQRVRQQRQIGPQRQRFRQRQFLAEDRFYALFKLGRMRRAEEQTELPFLQLIAQCAIGNGRVRF